MQNKVDGFQGHMMFSLQLEQLNSLKKEQHTALSNTTLKKLESFTTELNFKKYKYKLKFDLSLIF